MLISIQLVRIFSFMLQEGEVKLEKLAITPKYATDAKRIYKQNQKKIMNFENNIVTIFNCRMLYIYDYMFRYCCYMETDTNDASF